MLHFPFLRLEQAQITKQDVWQDHIFYFSLKALHIKQFWQNYNGKSETRPPGTSWMQGMFKDEFQCSSACCLATDFNSFQQNQCGAAGAGDFKATKPGEAWMSTCTEDKDLFLASGPLEPPAPAASLVQLFASTRRHWSQFMSPWGLQAY